MANCARLSPSPPTPRKPPSSRPRSPTPRSPPPSTARPSSRRSSCPRSSSTWWSNRVRPLAPLAAVALAACAGPEARSGPPPHPLPSGIRKLSLPPIVNKSQQPGLEALFGLAVRDEFLRDGRYPPVPEKESDGVVQITITRYILA